MAGFVFVWDISHFTFVDVVLLVISDILDNILFMTGGTIIITGLDGGSLRISHTVLPHISHYKSWVYMFVVCALLYHIEVCYSLKREYRHFDVIFVISWTGSCHFDNDNFVKMTTFSFRCWSISSIFKAILHVYWGNRMVALVQINQAC